MSLFERPHRCACTTYVDMELKPEALREVDDYDVWLSKVKDELLAVYGKQRSMDIQQMTYATCEAPSAFASQISAEMFDRLREHKAAVGDLEARRKELEEQQQMHDFFDAERARRPNGQLQRSERKEALAVDEKIAQLKKEIVAKEYTIACLSQVLSNVFKAEVVRIFLI